MCSHIQRAALWQRQAARRALFPHTARPLPWPFITTQKANTEGSVSLQKQGRGSWWRASKDWSCLIHHSCLFSAVHPSQHSTDFQQRKHLLGSSAVSFSSEQTFDKRLTKQSACHPAPLSKFQQGAGTCFCGYSRWDICSWAFAQCSLAAVIVALILSATGCFLSFHRASISLSGFVLRFF